ncbi:alpha/beta hydrolase [Streptomyces sp. ML-6]|uniref:alpha/beta fold hydrolase n=1 Tax=Streptomyces sp. ML-6 TaxID=2982693 RepID=UPI0024C025E5|nr:alpha/beta hydrolase [Streptomyces sp. ML-6]MDK0523581.1 alpha/beta hydrolase [Streptomyces sp. ML-6]
MADRLAPDRAGHLEVPGATLYHEVRGEGPLLLLLPGGSADAGIYDRMAARLADRWTVATLDPRGYSRSLLDGGPAEQRVAVQSEDAYRLIELLAPGGGPVSVFGASSGAIVALDLLARHPERLHRVVAHEPPLVELLPDPERGRRLFASVRDSFRDGGVAAALATMTEGLMDPDEAPALDEPPVPDEAQAPDAPPVQGTTTAAKTGRAAEPVEQTVREAEAVQRMHANLPMFLEHVLCSFSGHTLDLEALARGGGKLVVGIGEESGTLLTAVPASRLADRAGGRLVEFPGGHTGSSEHPEAFAARLRSVLLD